MDLTLPDLVALMRLTLQAPRKGARRIMEMNLPINARWLALLLVAAGSAIGTHLSIALMPPEQREMILALIASPMSTALMQAGIWAVIAAAIAVGGRMRGGEGTFPDALILMAWLQFMLLCLQLVQVAAGVVLPILADLIGLAGLGLLLWLLTNFVAELHGFRSLVAVFAGLVAGAFALMFLAAILLSVIFGSPSGGV
jgi:Yip1 domain